MSKDGKLPYFPFYPRDFLLDVKVQIMNPAARGAYIMLLCYAWLETPAGSLPDDFRQLSMLAGLGCTDLDDQNLKKVLECFESRGDGRIYQKRMVQEAKKVDEFRQSKAKAGRAGMASRWQRDNSPITDGYQTDNSVITELLQSDNGAITDGYQNITNHNHIHNQIQKEEEKRGTGGEGTETVPCRNGSEHPLSTALQNSVSSKQKRKNPMMTASAIEELKSNPAYAKIDIVKEAWKFKSWCETNDKNQSRRRFVNWLNRVS